MFFLDQLVFLVISSKFYRSQMSGRGERQRQNNTILWTMKSYATLPKSENDECQSRRVEHVAGYVVVEDEGILNKDGSYSQCGLFRVELDKLRSVVNEILNKQDEDRRNSESEKSRADAQIKSHIKRNNKIATEIEALKTTVEE